MRLVSYMATDAASVADSVEVIAEAPEGSLKTPVLYPAGMVEDKEASMMIKQQQKYFLSTFSLMKLLKYLRNMDLQLM